MYNLALSYSKKFKSFFIFLRFKKSLFAINLLSFKFNIFSKNSFNRFFFFYLSKRLGFF